MISIDVRIGRRRFIWIVRIIEMDPYKSRASGMRGQPSLCMAHNIHATPLNSPPARFARGMLGKVVIKVKSAIESECESLAVENYCADKCRGVVTLLLEQLGPGRMVRRQGDSE